MSCHRPRRSQYRSNLVVISMLLLACAGGCVRAKEPPPNILLVTLDTTRRDRLGCYSGGDLTPNFDRLAADGVRFDTAISTSGATPIAHASILTGLNPYRHGVRVIYAESGYRLRETVPTLPEILRDRGWATAAFLSSFTVSSFYGFDRGFEVFDEGFDSMPDESFQPAARGFWTWPLGKHQRSANETTAKAVRWMREGKRPFFAWVHYWDPHDDEIMPPADVTDRFVKSDMNDQQRRRAIYAADVNFVDSEFGKLIAALKQAEVYENTIIVVIADHGEGLGDHGWWYHRLLYQEQIRIPFLMRVPGWPKGTAVENLVRNIDVTPTILDLLDIELPKATEGASVAGLVLGRPEAEPRAAYADAINLFDLNAGMVTQRPDDALLHAVVVDGWKLIHRPALTGKDELYDLSADPQERNNLVAKEPKRYESLKRRLDRFGGYVDTPFGTPTDQEVIKRLKSLGYL